MLGMIAILNVGSFDFFINKFFNDLTLQFTFLIGTAFLCVVINLGKVYVDKIFKTGILYLLIGVLSYIFSGNDAYLFGLTLLGFVNGLLMYFALIQNIKLITMENLFGSLRVVFYVGSIFGLISEILGRLDIVIAVSWGYGFCMTLFPLVIYSMRGMKINKLGLLIRISPFLILILITSWRAFSLMSIIGISFSISRKFGNLKMLGIGLIGIFLALAVVLTGAKSSQADISSGRVFLWLKTIELISENGFVGAGYGQFSSYYYESIGNGLKVEVGGNSYEAPGQSKDRIHTHNSILQVLFDAGVLGLILFLLMISSLYKSINTIQKNKYLRKNLKITLFVMLGTSLFSSFGGINTMYFWMVSAIIMLIVRLDFIAENHNKSVKII